MKKSSIFFGLRTTRHKALALAATITIVGGTLGACDNAETIVAPPGAGGSSVTGGGGQHGGDASTGASLNFGGSVTALTLVLEPQNPVILSTGQPDTVQFTAKLSDGSPVGKVVWTTGDITRGGFTATPGLFRAGGLVAGTTTVTATAGSDRQATTTVTIKVDIVENTGSLSAPDQMALRAGGADDSDFRWLYPYNDTVFPRGILSPLLQFGGNAADASYLKVTVGDFSYQGFFSGSAPTRMQLPKTVWDAMTKSANATDTVTVEASKMTGGQVTGPATETWKIAQGTLRGAVYYNTYRSPLANNEGAVLRVRIGQQAELVLTGCTVCHSVSAQGNVLVAGVDWSGSDTVGNPPNNPRNSSSFDLLSDGTAPVRNTDTDGRKYAFGALTPDGARMLSSAVAASGFNPRGLSGARASKLYDTATGAEIAAPSFTSQVTEAMTPAFAPDGSRLAFTRMDNNDARTLAIMDYDGKQTPPLFSNLQEIVTTTNGVAAWPSFLPDAKAVVYHDGERFDTSNTGPSLASLHMVHVGTKAVNDLKQLNGYNKNGFYLPYGSSEEAELNYEPTVLPVAVGGYYWVVFTSRRAYGNTIAPGGTLSGGSNKWEDNSVRKKLWVAAIDIDYPNKSDPSHPAFYLDGQELEAGNMRGFASLEPCMPQGSKCDSAAQCCDGFCRETGEVDKDGAPITACVPPPDGCSNENEVCKTTADCCEASQLCINGRCTQPTPK